MWHQIDSILITVVRALSTTFPDAIVQTAAAFCDSTDGFLAERGDRSVRGAATASRGAQTAGGRVVIREP